MILILMVFFLLSHQKEWQNHDHWCFWLVCPQDMLLDRDFLNSLVHHNHSCRTHTKRLLDLDPTMNQSKNVRMKSQKNTSVKTIQRQLQLCNVCKNLLPSQSCRLGNMFLSPRLRSLGLCWKAVRQTLMIFTMTIQKHHRQNLRCCR